MYKPAADAEQTDQVEALAHHGITVLIKLCLTGRKVCMPSTSVLEMWAYPHSESYSQDTLSCKIASKYL